MGSSRGLRGFAFSISALVGGLLMPAGVVAQAPAGRIALTCHYGDTANDICTMKPDGTDLRRLVAREGEDLAPEWSPNGSRLALLDLGGGLRHVSASGTGEVVLTEGLRSEGGGGTYAPGKASWSPSGARLAFTWHRLQDFGAPQPDTSYVAVIDADGRNEAVVSDFTAASDPVWSSTNRLAALATKPGVGRGLWLFGPAGEGATLLSNRNLEPTSWAPDGSRLLVEDDSGGLSFVNASNGAVSPFKAEARRGDFSPDGQWVVYESHEGGGMYIARVDGSQTRRIACEFFAPSWGLVTTVAGTAVAKPTCPQVFDVARPAPRPACSDGRDNDGDPYTDFPRDPGCESATDRDERDCYVAGRRLTSEVLLYAQRGSRIAAGEIRSRADACLFATLAPLASGNPRPVPDSPFRLPGVVALAQFDTNKAKKKLPRKCRKYETVACPGRWDALGRAFASDVQARGRYAGWAINEIARAAPSRPLRSNLAAMVKGLGSRGLRGAVFVIDPNQRKARAPAKAYKRNLKAFLASPSSFWRTLGRHVRWWAPELYANCMATCLPGARLSRLRTNLADFILHPVRPAFAGPRRLGAARSFLRSRFTPLLNAHWRGCGYGQSHLLAAESHLPTMESLIRLQVFTTAHARERTSYLGQRVGFAWNESTAKGKPCTVQRRIAPVHMTGAQAQRLASTLGKALGAGYGAGGAAPRVCATGSCTPRRRGARPQPSWRLFARW